MADVVVLGRVLNRGQVTVPRAVRQAAGLQPGDVVAFEATAPGVIEIRMLPRLKLAQALERYRIEGPINEPFGREQWQDVAARDVIRE